jgi:hypothetical protein
LADLPHIRTDINAFLAALAPTEGHPLLDWCRSFNSDMEKTSALSTFYLTHPTCLLLELYGAVCAIKHLDNFARIENDLKNADHFLSAVYEAVVAATYINHGYVLEIQKEKQGERTCDFRLHTPTGHVDVEAKRLFNLSAEENRYWRQIAKTIHSRMQKEQRSWLVRVTSQRRLDFKEQDVVMHEITRMARDNKPRHRSLIDRTAHVECTEIQPWGEAREVDQIAITEKAEIVSMSCVATSGQRRRLAVKNMVVILVQPYEVSDFVNRAIKLIRKAASQLPSNEPSLVHLHLPITKGDSMLRAADRIFQQ